jgi:hypothetical protein
MVARLARLARLASTLTATIFGSTSTSVHDVVYSSHDSTTPGRAVSWPSIARPPAKVTAINRQPLSGTAYHYQMTAASAQNRSPVAPVPAGQMPATRSSITITRPPVSVTTLDAH